MTRDDIKASVIRNLTRVAPDVDENELDAAVNFRDQFDFDSMDFLNFIIALCKELKIDIPEADYPQLQSVDSSLEYLCRKLSVS
jgi:acyl carrier protein